MTTEEWREIPGTGYFVSSEGRVASNKRSPWRILVGGFAKGYRKIDMLKNGVQHSVTVHSLVAEAFIGPRPSPKHQVNHKNGVKTDNRAINFEYVTCKENIRHSLDVLGKKRAHGEKIGSAKITEAEVREIRVRRARGETLASIAADYGVCIMTISHIATRKTWAWLDADTLRRPA